MEIFKFNIKGDTAFFKKPDVNTYRYLTYGQLHKVALCGILGCVIGLNGYREQKEEEQYPEFYEKLKDIKVSIVPKNKDGRIGFLKSFQNFNNSVGYASFEKGGNLIVKEQWLVDVSWDVYMVVEDELARKIKEHIENRNTIFMPYLGKNDHYLEFDNFETFEVADWANMGSVKNIESLFLKEDIIIDNESEKVKYGAQDKYWDNTYSYKEYLPCGLDNKLCYVNKMMIKTDKPVKVICIDSKIATINGKNLFFF